MIETAVTIATQTPIHRMWFGPRDPAGLGGVAQSTVGHEIDGLYEYILWVMTISFVLLMALMFWFVAKYRRRAGVAPLLSRSHNTPIEIAWTVIPTVVMVPMFFYGFFGYAEQLVAPANYLDVNLTAGQWYWRWSYPPGGAESTEKIRIGATDVPVFYAPAGRPVRLRMQSMDVIHSFWVPDFRTKFDVFPNRYTAYWFEAPPLREGEASRDHMVFCAEYCGDLHSEMAAVIRVVSPERYAAWIEEMSVPGSPIEGGKRLYESICFTCHAIDGPVKTGPNWRKLFGYPSEYTDGTRVEALDENEIRESILLPGKKVRRGFPNQMTSFQGQLSPEKIDWIIAYMQSLSDKDAQGNPRAPEETPEAAPEGGGN
jgi:cytochrome c oxidase subunit 2